MGFRLWFTILVCPEIFEDCPPNEPTLADYLVIPAVSDVFFFLPTFLPENDEMGLMFEPDPTLC